MPVDSIQNSQHRSVIVPIAKGACIGAIAGYGAKYVLPLTNEEKSSDEYVKVVGKINEEKHVYNIRTKKYIDALKAKVSKSSAEDVFIGMFEGLKFGEKMPKANIKNAIKTLQEVDPAQVFNLKRLCKDSSAIVAETGRQCVEAYDLFTKHIRPTGFFLGTGAVVGAFVALTNDLLRVRDKD